MNHVRQIYDTKFYGKLKLYVYGWVGWYLQIVYVLK